MPSKFSKLFATGPVQPVPKKAKTKRPDFRPYQDGDFADLSQAIMEGGPKPKPKPQPAPKEIVARMPATLSPLLAHLIREGVKLSGSYDPDEALIGVESSMTAADYQVAQMFLTWCVEKGRVFGHNIADVFAEYATGGPDTSDAYDRELFEGLFLRHGKAWVNQEMARLIAEFPSYRKD